MSNSKRHNNQQNPDECKVATGTAVVPVRVASSHKLDDLPDASDKSELSEQERDFVDHYTTGKGTAGNATASAKAAGYAENSAYVAGSRLINRPRVRSAIDAALREAITSRMSVQAVRVLADVLENEDANPKLRAEVAMKVVEYSGVIERAQTEKAQQTGLSARKRLGEMSREELAAIVAAGAALVAKAGASAQDSAQVIDITPK